MQVVKPVQVVKPIWKEMHVKDNGVDSNNGKINSRKSVTWPVVPNAPMLVYVGMT